MHIVTQKSELASQLSFVSGASDSRGTVPMLGTVLIKAMPDGKVSLLCSDTGMVARAPANCQVAKEGEIAVDARRFGDLIRAIGDNKQSIDIALEATGDNQHVMVLKSGRSRFRLPTLPAADYPRMIPEKANRMTIAMSGDRIGQMIEEVSSAMAVNDVRAFLNGVLVSLNADGLWFVGTDGHRLCVAFEPIDGADRLPPTSVIVPRKTILLARKLVSGEGSVKLTIGPKDIQFTLESGTIILGKGMDGAYPDFKRILPKTTRSASFSSSQFKDALLLVKAGMDAAPAQDAKMKNRIDLMIGGSNAVLQHGEDARCDLECTSDSPDTTMMAFNVSYLCDAAEVVASTGEKLAIGYDPNGNAVCLRPEGKDYPLCVVMALRA